MMKRYRLIIFVAVLVLIVFVAFVVILCDSHNKPISGESNISIDVNMDDEKNFLEIDVINNGDSPLICDLIYEIEVFKNNRWSLYQGSEDTDAIGIEIQAHDKYVQTLSMSDFPTFEPGVYRVVKTIRGNQYFSNEFHID